MGIFKAVGDFLFGKDPDIFDKQGNVSHKHPEEKWVRWDQRIRQNPDYDWRDHTGANLGKKVTAKSGNKTV